MVTIIGGIISNQSGYTITYKLKCKKCENTEQSETTVNLTKGVTEISTKKCSKCGNNQMIKLKHTDD